MSKGQRYADLFYCYFLSVDFLAFSSDLAYNLNIDNSF